MGFGFEIDMYPEWIYHKQFLCLGCGWRYQATGLFTHFDSCPECSSKLIKSFSRFDKSIIGYLNSHCKDCGNKIESDSIPNERRCEECILKCDYHPTETRG